MRVFRITKDFTNAYLLVDEKNAILIDTLYPKRERFIIEKIKTLKIDFKLQAIFLTHAHLDHAGSAKAISEIFKVPVIAHRLCKDFLEKGENEEIKPYGIIGNIVYVIYKAKDRPYPALSPDIIFDTTFSLEEFGVKGELIYTPGHTYGSASLVAKDEVFVGDVIMGIPNPYRPSFPFFAISPGMNEKSIKEISKKEVKRIYPGHGIPWEMDKIKGLVERRVYKKLLQFYNSIN